MKFFYYVWRGISGMGTVMLGIVAFGAILGWLFGGPFLGLYVGDVYSWWFGVPIIALWLASMGMLWEES